MTKLLSILSLILAIVLFPPAALALISNNAIPGDSTYPIKRSLEDIIYAAASVNPTTKAWFAGARSDRRYQEVTVLIAQGKEAKSTLNELVEQTQIAATQINQVSDPAQKEKLVSQLTDSITKYDQGLAQISKTQFPAVSTQPVATQPPVLKPSPPPPAPAQTVSMPSGSTLQPSPPPQSPTAPQVSPTPQSSAQVSPPTPATPNSGGKSDIDRARSELERIKNELEKRKQNHNTEVNSTEKGNVSQQNKNDKQEENDNQSSKNGK